MENKKNNFSQNIKIFRKKRGITLLALAKYLGFKSKSTIKSYEIGKSEPSIENLIKISKLFKISIDKLIK